jgi:diguanylate cyclase (GGDEF)-like protein
MPRFHSLDAAALRRFLERQRAAFSLGPDPDDELPLTAILEKARAFVPAVAGSILLDDPRTKGRDRSANELVFVAAFGPGTEGLPGRRLPPGEGIAGRVYVSGEPHVSENVTADAHLHAVADSATGQPADSVICVPVTIGDSVIGVLELVNRADGLPFSATDLQLLQVFADYTSITLQAALDARRARELAKRDDLTGLFNDRWFHHRLATALEEAESTGETVALVFFDLDRFKEINDRYGHMAGSQVLREVGFLVRRLVPSGIATAARYGGDEFVVILPGCGTADGLTLGEMVRREISGAVFTDRSGESGLPTGGVGGVVTASVGVAVYQPGRGGSLVERKIELIRRVDAAMYASKAQGRDRVTVDPASLPAPGTAGGSPMAAANED